MRRFNVKLWGNVLAVQNDSMQKFGFAVELAERHIMRACKLVETLLAAER